MMRIREISLYTVFGVLTTLISILTYRLFLIFNIHYVLATTLSTIVAIAFAYVTNRLYVFNSKGSVVKESIQFFIGRIIVFIVETIVLIILVSWMNFDEFYSKIVVTTLVVIANYFYSKFIVFREGGKSEE